MHVIIIGCGKVGASFAKILHSEGHDVVIVDNDANNFKALGPGFAGVMITGVPIDQDVLKRAGIETADALAAVTPDDNVNIMVCQVAKEIFKIPKVIARIYNPDREHVFHHFGLETICPTNLTVDVIRSIITGENGVSEHTIGKTALIFEHRKVDTVNAGKLLSDVIYDNGEFVFGYIKDGVFNFANKQIRLEARDILVIAKHNK